MCTPRTSLIKSGSDGIRSSALSFQNTKRPFFNSVGSSRRSFSNTVTSRENNEATCKGDLYEPPAVGLVYFTVLWYDAPDIVSLPLISSGDDAGLNLIGFYSLPLKIIVDGALTTQNLYCNTNPVAPDIYLEHLAFWVTDLYDGTNFFDGWLIYKL